MSRLVVICASCALMVGAAVLFADDAAGVAVGKNLPGSFQPYNVNAALPVVDEPEEEPQAGPKRLKYSTRGKFHSLITEYDLDPVVLLVARGLEDEAAFRAVLGKLDAALDRNRAARLRCFVVFVASDLGNVVLDDDRRDEIVKKLEKLVDDAKLRRVVVTLAGKDDLARFRLDETKALTAVLYRKLQVEAIHKIDKDALEPDGPAVKALLGDVRAKLGATR